MRNLNGVLRVFQEFASVERVRVVIVLGGCCVWTQFCSRHQAWLIDLSSRFLEDLGLMPSTQLLS